MLWRKLLMAGVSGPALTTCWVVPGGRILFQSADGDLLLADHDQGWPWGADAGDPFVDAQGRVGLNVQRSLGGGVGQVDSVRFGRDLREQAVRSLGPYRGWAGENVAAFVNSLGYGLGGTSHTFPSYTLQGVQGGFETGHTAGWAWEQQDGGNAVSGEPTVSPFIQTIQSDYIAGMAYPWGACAARNLGVVLKQVATAYSDEQDVDPATGRRWLGWTVDAAGTKRRIGDLTPAQMRQLGHEQGFRPPNGTIVESSNQAYAWQFLRPLGPLGDDAVLATGCISYSESYVRHPDAEEWPWFLAGNAGYSENPANPDDAGNRQPMPLLDAPVNMVLSSGYATDPSRLPLKITETRNSLIFVTVLITAGGLSQLVVTGRTASRSAKVQPASPNRSFYVMKRQDGVYDVFVSYPWTDTGQAPPADDPFGRHGYDGGVTDTRFSATTPNGWKVAIEVPQKLVDGAWVDDPAYRPIIVHADTPDGQAVGPERPQGCDDDRDGPWIQPPNDIDYAPFWRGLPYWNKARGRVQYQPGNNFYLYAKGEQGTVLGRSAYAPAGPYPHDGDEAGYLRTGSFVVAQHDLGGAKVYAVHQAVGIVPGIGATRETATPDGTDPTMRLLRWPGRSWMIGRTQRGGWMRSRDGGSTWQAMIDLGAMEGTASVAARFERPDPPEPAP